MSERPNILLIHSDQHRYDCTGLGGHPQAATPNLDWMQKHGVVFRNAFTAIPLCCPARQSMLCGQYPFRHQALCNYDIGELKNTITPQLPVYSKLLADSGYRLTYVGKWHVHPTLDPTDFGFHKYISEQDYWSWRKDQGLPLPTFPEMPCCKVDPVLPEQTRMHWMTDRAIEAVRETSDEQSPFHIRLDLVEPHLPNLVPEPFASRLKPSEIEPWGSFGDTFEGKPWIQKQMLYHWGIQDWDWERWQPLVASYLNDIAFLDFQIGRVIDALKQSGQLDNTMLVYTSDHGDMMGSHGMYDKHHVLYDDVVHIPFYIHWPKGIVRNGIREEFITHCLDLPVTFLDVANCEIPNSMQGHSLLTLLRDAPCGEWPDEIYASLHGSQFGLYSQRMVRDRKYKYIFNATDVDELYDLEKDPWELNNLAGVSTCQIVLKHYRERLLDWAEKTQDDFILNMYLRKSIEDGRLL